MGRRLPLRRPGHATVVAYLALFVALGGSSYAALQIGSRQIADNSVRSKDIRNNNLRGADVRRDTLTGADVNESQLGTVPRAAAADRADLALSVPDNSIGGAKVANDTLSGIDIIESQLGTVPMAATAATAQDIDDGIVTGAKVPQDALTGDDVDESTLEGVDAETFAGRSIFQFTRHTFFSTIADGSSFDIPFFGRLTTECAAGNTEWHYLNNTGSSQDIWMDVGGGDAVYRRLPNMGTLDSGNNGAADTFGERIAWHSFFTTVFTFSARTTTPAGCRMGGIAYFPPE